jgi:hypothetical protein
MWGHRCGKSREADAGAEPSESAVAASLCRRTPKRCAQADSRRECARAARECLKQSQRITMAMVMEHQGGNIAGRQNSRW